MSNFLVGLIAGFGICSFLTNRLLMSKAMKNERPCIDSDNSIYWQEVSDMAKETRE